MNGEHFKEDDELKEIAPRLFNMPKRNPFTVPENYFDALPALVREKIAAGEKKPAWQRIFSEWLQPSYALAACIVVLILASGIYFSVNKTHPSIPQEAERISVEEISASGMLFDMDETLIANELDEISNSESTSADTTLENYILDQADVNDIVNEL